MGGDKWSVAALPSPSPSPSPLRSPRHRRALSAHANVWPHCRARCRGRGATMGGPLGARWRRVGQKRGRWGGGIGHPGGTATAPIVSPPGVGPGRGRGHSGDLSLDCATTRPQSHRVPRTTLCPQSHRAPKGIACPQSHHVPKDTMSPKPPPVPKATTCPQSHRLSPKPPPVPKATMSP